jgi:predicted metal-dependent hydrolase
MFLTKTERYNRENARNVITAKAHEFSVRYGLVYNRIAIRNQRTRLGSCSSMLNLNFNWQITKFPENIMDYIILHELAHLKHQNHSKEFWKEVSLMDPDYKIHNKWVKNNGHKYLKF